ncbi:phospholipase B1, membrane-associated-like [Frankliniella occidentalis]|uniref:Phospholipase B1, membrane-associated n=1 Tax=Frankliniella occidentalis TaxID=133901 RepID=A0A6J1SD53_FRAOC|nr:phospholipase B1, membrane-associated-like [Frankliniella occidentalis]
MGAMRGQRSPPPPLLPGVVAVLAVITGLLLAIASTPASAQLFSSLANNDILRPFRQTSRGGPGPGGGSPLDQSGIRRQPLFPSSMPFPCNASAVSFGRSRTTPTSVHRLRPGDIAVVGAMGDSLVAGNGALEEFALGTLIEYRGVSWCAGGQGDWRHFLTLPNILKQFNPNLKGYSTGKGEFLASNAHMNVAFPVSAASDAYKQAVFLVKKMKKDPFIDFHNDWKMVTMLFGANDICSAQCYDREGTSANQHGRKLKMALDYLHQNLPRTYVNLVPVIDPSVSLRVKRSFMCRVLHRFFCQCFHLDGNADEMDIITSLVRDFQNAERQLVESGRYDTRDDFTVVIQPFMKLFNAPRDRALWSTEVIDISYVTYDCFHFSQKGHAMAANLLWNNILQPVGFKSTTLLPGLLKDFKCPSREAPFLFTANNTRTFLATGSQYLPNERNVEVSEL